MYEQQCPNFALSVGLKKHKDWFMKRNAPNIWLPTLFALAMAVGIFFGYKMRDSFPTTSFFHIEKNTPLQEVLKLVENKYVDSMDIDALTDTAIGVILHRLDPHSVYITPEEVEAANDEIKGSFFGIGIEYDIYDDTINVLRIIEDGPAQKAGLLAGDKIIKANDKLLAGKNITHEDVRSNLKGKLGSITNLEIIRGTQKLTLPVERNIVQVNSVSAAFMIDDSTGFIHLERFSQNTYREFMLALESLVMNGMTQLVLDLRGNGGGVMDAAVEIADEFLDGDKLITYTKGLHVPRMEFRCRRNGMFEKGKLMVLADEGSASASEILLGALQDWDRATIIGRRSFGKGLVQEQFDLSNNGALRLTIARYYTPLGRSIQRKYSSDLEKYYNDVYERSDSLFIDSNATVFRTPKGKNLYEAGGITPDYFIPSDTGKVSPTLAYIYGNRLVSKFAYQYVQAEKKYFEGFEKPIQFYSNFQIDEKSLDFFQKNVLKDSAQLFQLYDGELKFLKRSMKLQIARQLWGNEGYYKIFNEEDEGIKKALELMKAN